MSSSENNTASTGATVAPEMWKCLREAADSRGLVSFRDFMEIALYGSEGYYQKNVQLGGAGSDFYTAAQFPLFAMTIAHYILGRYNEQRKTGPIRIVEFGPGQGELAYNLCTYLLANPAAQAPVEYFFVERSERLKRVQAERMAGLSDRIHFAWLDGTTSRNPLPHAFVISNELLDALPAERVRRTGQGYEQSFVQLLSDGGVREAFRPANAKLSDLAGRYVPVPVSHSAEICLHYSDIFEHCASLALSVDGLFFDYGTYAAEWRTGIRPNGTVRAYRRHQLVDPLERPGEADITVDVNWDFARDCAAEAGFEVSDIVSQGSFLMKHGIMDVVSTLSNNLGAALSPNAGLFVQGSGHEVLTRALKQLVFPGGMGERFSAFVFQKRGEGGRKPC